MLDNITQLIDKITEGIAIDEKGKKALMTVYQLASFKIMLEMLFVYKVGNSSFYNDLITFFDKNISTLDEAQRKSFDSFMKEENEKILINIFTKFGNDLPEEDKQKVKKNLNNLTEIK